MSNETQFHSTTADDEDVILACRYGDEEDVKAYISRFGLPSFLRSRDERGNSAIHMLCANGHDELLAYILAFPGLSARALRARNSSRSTPLHWAAVNQQLGSAKLIIEAANKLAAAATGSKDASDEPDSDLDDDVDGTVDDATGADNAIEGGGKGALKHIRDGGSLVLMTDGTGRTPLGEAELGGWDEGARFLVSVMELSVEKANESISDDVDGDSTSGKTTTGGCTGADVDNLSNQISDAQI